jgi:hypothetical protein
MCRTLQNVSHHPRWSEHASCVDTLQGLLHSLKLVTRARRCCDRALCSLPITQHTRVWSQYLALVRQHPHTHGPRAVQPAHHAAHARVVAVPRSGCASTLTPTDRALCSLPITQHTRVWSQYLALVAPAPSHPRTAPRVELRFILEVRRAM